MDNGMAKIVSPQFRPGRPVVRWRIKYSYYRTPFPIQVLLFIRCSSTLALPLEPVSGHQEGPECPQVPQIDGSVQHFIYSILTCSDKIECRRSALDMLQ